MPLAGDELEPIVPGEIYGGAFELKWSEGSFEGDRNNRITGLTMEYLDPDTKTWVQITESTGQLDPTWQFRFNYTVDALLYSTLTDEEANPRHQIYYKLSSDVAWFEPSDTQTSIWYNNINAAQIKGVTDGDDVYLVLTFTDAFIKYLQSDAVNNSNFKLEFGCYGGVNEKKLPNDGQDVDVPGLGFDVDFFDNLTERYGTLDIDKKNPGTLPNKDNDEPVNGPLVQVGSSYYLAYTITVTNEEDASMDGIYVDDLLVPTEYGFKYVGIDETSTTVPSTSDIANDYYGPSESIVNGGENPQSGTISMNEEGTSFRWNIGTLAPGETRTLTYFVDLGDNYITNFMDSMTGPDSDGGLAVTNEATVYAAPDGEVVNSKSDQNSYSPNASFTVVKSEPNADDLTVDGTGDITYFITITADDDNTFSIGGESLILVDSFGTVLEDFLGTLFQDDEDDNGVYDTYALTIDVYRNPESPSDPSGDTFTTITVEKPYNGTFTFKNFTLEPGDTYVLKYTVHFYQALWGTQESMDGANSVNLTNTATLQFNGGTLASDDSTLHLDLNQLAEKLDPEPIDEDVEQNGTTEDDYKIPLYKYIPGEDGSYSITGPTTPAPDNTIDVDGNPLTLMYQVTLNPGAKWDLKSTILNDALNRDDVLHYKGYLQIDYYQADGTTLEGTVYLDIDDQTEFTFTPSEIGLKTDATYYYVLTYYAQMLTANGSASMTNDFGEVKVVNTFSAGGGIEDPESGNRHPFPGWDWVDDPTNPGYEENDETQIPGVEVTQSELVPGNYPTNSLKSAWYLNTNLDYNTDLAGYDNGVLYWVLTVEENFGSEGKDANGNTTYNPYMFYDTPGSNSKFVSGSEVVGVFVGKGEIDVNGVKSNAPESPLVYGRSLSTFMDEYETADPKLTKLDPSYYTASITDTSIKTGPVTVDGETQYLGSTVAAGSLAFNFTSGYLGSSDYQSLNTKAQAGQDGTYAVAYIILRATPTSSMLGNTSSTTTYSNSLYCDSGMGAINKSTVSLSYSTLASVYKQAEGSAYYDGETFRNDVLSSDPEASSSDWNFVADGDSNRRFDPVKDGSVSAEDATGIYAIWNVHVNHSGLMQGDAYIIDELPLGMTPIYMYTEYYGSSFSPSEANPNPTLPQTAELATSGSAYRALSSDQQQMVTDFKANGQMHQDANGVTTTWYYDDEVVDSTIDTESDPTPEVTRVMWYVKDIPAMPLDPETGMPDKETSANEIRYHIVCKVADTKGLFAGEKFTNFTSALGSVLNPSSSATMTIARNVEKIFDDSGFNKDNGTFKYEDDEISSQYEYLPFSITVNPMADDIYEGSATLPDLIDQFPSTMFYSSDVGNYPILERYPLNITAYDAAGNEVTTAMSGWNPATNVVYDANAGENTRTITFKNLPDGYKLVIDYILFVDVTDGTGFFYGSEVSNTAYWEGGAENAKPQMPMSTFYFYPHGMLYDREIKTAAVAKVSAEDPDKVLPGAHFTLYDVTPVRDEEGNYVTAPNGGNQLEYQYMGEGVTDKNGYLGFNMSSPGVPDSSNSMHLRTNTLYCLLETQAPDGYVLANGEQTGPVEPGNEETQTEIDEENAYYFIIVDPGVYIQSDDDLDRDPANAPEDSKQYQAYMDFVNEAKQYYNLDATDHITFWTQGPFVSLTISDPPGDRDLEVSKTQMVITDDNADDEADEGNEVEGSDGQPTNQPTLIYPSADNPVDIRYTVKIRNIGETPNPTATFSDLLPAGVALNWDSLTATIYNEDGTTSENDSDIKDLIQYEIDAMTGETSIYSSEFKLLSGQYAEIVFDVTISALNGTSTWKNVAYGSDTPSNEVETFAPYLSVQKLLEGVFDADSIFGFKVKINAPTNEVLPGTLAWETNTGYSSSNASEDDDPDSSMTDDEDNGGDNENESTVTDSGPDVIYTPSDDLTSATITFYLHADESIVFPNLPIGTSFIVMETDAGGYDLQSVTNNGEGMTSETQPSGIVFVNAPDDGDENPESAFEVLKTQANTTGMQDVTTAAFTNNPLPVSAGDQITYKITATNNTDAVASDVVIADEVPYGLTLLNDSITNGGTYDPTTNVITWNLGNLAPGQSVSVYFSVTVPDVSGPTTWRNIASATYDEDTTVPSNPVIALHDALGATKRLAQGTPPTDAIFNFTATFTIPSDLDATLPEEGVEYILFHGADIIDGVMDWNSGATSTTGSISFSLAANDTIVFMNLPTGTNYSIVENATSGYRLASSMDTEGTITEDGASAVFVNASLSQSTPGGNAKPVPGTPGNGNGSGTTGSGLAKTGDMLSLFALIAVAAMGTGVVFFLRKRTKTK